MKANYNNSEYEVAQSAPSSFVKIGEDENFTFYVDPNTPAGVHEMSEAAWRDWYENQYLPNDPGSCSGLT